MDIVEEVSVVCFAVAGADRGEQARLVNDTVKPSVVGTEQRDMFDSPDVVHILAKFDAIGNVSEKKLGGETSSGPESKGAVAVCERRKS